MVPKQCPFRRPTIWYLVYCATCLGSRDNSKYHTHSPTHIHIHTYMTQSSRISIDCLTPASRIRRSASVWTTDYINPRRHSLFRHPSGHGGCDPPRVWLLIDLELWFKDERVACHETKPLTPEFNPRTAGSLSPLRTVGGGGWVWIFVVFDRLSNFEKCNLRSGHLKGLTHLNIRFELR